MPKTIRTSQSPERMQNFARFFRGYMGTAPIIAAALPIPITAGKVIPTYHEHTSFLTAYCSMFCFLAVAFVFYRRHRLGTYLLPELWEKRSRIVGRFFVSWLPLILILLTASSVILYHGLLYTSLTHQLPQVTHQLPQVREEVLSKPFNRLEENAEWPVTHLLEIGDIRHEHIVFQAIFFGSYFGIFIFSTLAFSLMAVREFMQSELGLTERDLVIRSGDPSARPVKRNGG